MAIYFAYALKFRGNKFSWDSFLVSLVDKEEFNFRGYLFQWIFFLGKNAK